MSHKRICFCEQSVYAESPLHNIATLGKVYITHYKVYTAYLIFSNHLLATEIHVSHCNEAKFPLLIPKAALAQKLRNPLH